MRMIVFLLGLAVVAFCTWHFLMGAQQSVAQPSAPKATLDRVREKTQAAMDKEQQRFDAQMKRTSDAVNQ